VSDLVGRLLQGGRGIWRKAAPYSVRSAIRPLIAGLVERRAFAGIARPEPAWKPGPLVVSGLLRETKGVSQAARLTVQALQTAGCEPVSHDLRTAFEAGPGATMRLPTEREGGVWLIHCNAPEALNAFASIDPASWRGRYRIGYWAYELPISPPSWSRAARLFSEIWAPSHFVAEALRKGGVATPIRVMPHPVALAAESVSPERARFGFEPETVCVLAMGDLLSSATRKNLLGAIDIYCRAFPEATRKTRLVVKALSTASHPAFASAARAAAAGRPDIDFLTEELPQNGVLQLIASCDILLSPHRSEGFGLALAEAFMMNVPALATGWSGNMDFMKDIPELLIWYVLKPVRDRHGVYRGRGLSWAEPDVADAAAKLRLLALSPQMRGRVAELGRRSVERQSLSWTRACLDQTAIGSLVETKIPA